MLNRPMAEGTPMVTRRAPRGHGKAQAPDGGQACIQVAGVERAHTRAHSVCGWESLRQC